MLNVEPNQIWASKKNEDVQRIIIQMGGNSESLQKNALYVEYWKDQDRLTSEGFCSLTHLKSWGKIAEQHGSDKLLKRAFKFLVQDRFSRAQMMLTDLASVIAEQEDQKEVLEMTRRLQAMASNT